MLNQKGFTLMEIMIVIIIIGILASMATPSYIKTIERAKDQDAKLALLMLQAAEKMYQTENGAYFASNDIDAINRTLRLNIQTTYWTYAVYDAPPPLAEAAAVNPSTGWDRTWQIDISGAPSCLSGPCNY